MKKWYPVVLAVIFILTTATYIVFQNTPYNKSESVSPALVSPTQAPTEMPEELFAIADFKQRITKKPFGIYITPENSPVTPERFRGFHTGADVEYDDVYEDVPVYALCDGEIVRSAWISDYGGTTILMCKINNRVYYLLYGHLKPDQITTGTLVTKNQQIGILGQGYSHETDNERKHLHLSIHKDTLDVRGYVQNKSELEGWVDPAGFLRG